MARRYRSSTSTSPTNNDWLAVNQFTVTENRNTRRPDVVLFVNGLPLGVIELKNPADEDATIWTAWQQLQTYKAELPTLFSMNEALMVSDGTEARIGTLTSGREWFKPWSTITGEGSARFSQIPNCSGWRTRGRSCGARPRLLCTCQQCAARLRPRLRVTDCSSRHRRPDKAVRARGRGD